MEAKEAKAAHRTKRQKQMRSYRCTRLKTPVKSPDQFRLVEYNKAFEPHPGIAVTYKDAGHYLGSAFLELSVTEDGKTTRVVFSGDLGRPGTLLMHDPVVASQADYLFIESTYGDRNHKNEEATFDELAEAIAYSYNNHDKVIIPAFAVGRTQEILYCLYLLRQKGKLPDDMPIFVDSPLADPRNGSLQRIQGLFGHARDRPVREHVRIAAQPEIYLERFGVPGVECDERAGDHHFRKRNVPMLGASSHHSGTTHGVPRPASSLSGIRVSARRAVRSSMAQAPSGFSMKMSPSRPKFLRLAGFPRTPGRARFWIGSGKWRIPVCRSCWCMAKRKHSRSFPALSKTSSIFQCMLPAIWKKWLLRRELLPKWSLPPNRRVMRHVDWELLLEETEGKLSKLRTRLEKAGERPWDEQVDIRDRILELNKELLSVLTQL